MQIATIGFEARITEYELLRLSINCFKWTPVCLLILSHLNTIACVWYSIEYMLDTPWTPACSVYI